MIAIVPGYISRSVAGSYDNEGIFTLYIVDYKDYLSHFKNCRNVTFSSNCNFLHVADLLHVDQIRKNWKHFVGYNGCSSVLLYGNFIF